MKAPSKILLGAVVIALALNTLSVVRAHKMDWGKAPLEVLRSKDRGLMEVNRQYIELGRKGMINLEFHDVAFAQFPARVTQEKLPHTLAL